MSHRRDELALSRTRLIVGLTVGVMATSCAALFIRFVQAEGVPTLSIAAWRLIFASSVLIPYSWFRYRHEIRRFTGREWVLLVTSGAFLGLHFATWIASLGYTSVASSVVLVSMGPLFVGVGSWVFLHERMTRPVLIGILLACLGSLIIGWGDFDDAKNQLLGDLLALTGAVMVAGYLMIGRHVRTHATLIAYIAPVYAVAMLTLLLIVAVSQQPMLGFSRNAYGWMILLGLVPQLIGHSVLNWALKHLSATYVSLVTLTEPIGSSLLAYLILGERVSILIAIGGMLVLLGLAIASRPAPTGPDGAQQM